MSQKAPFTVAYLPRSYYKSPSTFSTAELILTLEKLIAQDCELQQAGIDTWDASDDGKCLNQAEFMSELDLISQELLKREFTLTRILKSIDETLLNIYRHG